MNKNVFKSVPLKLSDQAGFIENTLPSNVQVLRTGKYFHQGREIPIAKDDLSKMIVNFNEKVRGIDLMIDFGHDSEGEAAAWFEELYLSEEGTELWAKVHWTESGKDAVLSKKYRYISADFDFNYTDNENLAEYGPTLFGAGLTNRPVVKRMQPVIQLSEKINYNEERKMDLEKKMEELMAMLKALTEKVDLMEKGMGEDKEEMKEEEEKPEMAEKEEEKEELSEEKEEDVEEKKVLLSETAKLIEENKKLKKENEFNKLFTEGKVVEAQREAFMSDDMIAFSEAAVKINTTNNGTTKEDEKIVDAEEEVIKLAEKLENDEGLEFGKAVVRVLNENPKLSEEYKKLNK